MFTEFTSIIETPFRTRVEMKRFLGRKDCVNDVVESLFFDERLNAGRQVSQSPEKGVSHPNLQKTRYELTRQLQTIFDYCTVFEN